MIKKKHFFAQSWWTRLKDGFCLTAAETEWNHWEVGSNRNKREDLLRFTFTSVPLLFLTGPVPDPAAPPAGRWLWWRGWWETSRPWWGWTWAPETGASSPGGNKPVQTVLSSAAAKTTREIKTRLKTLFWGRCFKITPPIIRQHKHLRSSNRFKWDDKRYSGSSANNLEFVLIHYYTFIIRANAAKSGQRPSQASDVMEK